MGRAANKMNFMTILSYIPIELCIVKDNLDELNKLLQLQNSDIVTAHGDCHLDNFMYCEQSGVLTMIDVELMRPYPAAFDLAFHFQTYESILVVRLSIVNSIY